MSGLRLAVLDADRGFVTVLAHRLDRLGFSHELLGAPVAPDELVAMRLDALVLDLGPLGDAGWDYLERVSGALPGLGLVVCSGPASVAERVRGLRLGADDWLTKPCHPEELIARVEAVARRRRQADARGDDARIVIGEIVIRPDRFDAFCGDRALELTRREFELVHLLADAAGQVLEREEIYRRVWGYEMARGDRSVDVFVRKLRQKLAEASPGWRYVHTHVGVGYRLAAEPEHPAPGPAASEPAAPSAPRAAAASV